MKNFKLILRSLLNNDSAIDGGRKKPWYFAIIIFVFSMIVSLVPTFVKYIKTNGDDIFNNGSSYGIEEAVWYFSKENLYSGDHEMKVVYVPQTEEKTLECDDFTWEYKSSSSEDAEVLFQFVYDRDLTEEEFNNVKGDGKTGFMIFTPKTYYLYIVNPVTKEQVAAYTCEKAYEKFDNNYNLKDLFVNEGNATERIDATWSNWKTFVRKAYDHNRLRNLWVQCLILFIINFIITALMGFMIWILTRGKNNPYKIFTFWESQKISYWCALTPAVLALTLGFLFKSYASVLFPLLIGIRVMWLTSKSLRPDGSGYGDSK